MAAHNITKGMIHTLGAAEIEEHRSTLLRSQVALVELATRGNTTGRLILKAPEMQALNDMLALHDNLMDVVTVQQFERALHYARGELKAKRCVSVKGLPA